MEQLNAHVSFQHCLPGYDEPVADLIKKNSFRALK